MIPEFGHFALILAFCLALIQVLGPVIGYNFGNARLSALAAPAALAQFICIGISFAALSISFATSDFSVALVVNNSHTLKPLLFKLSGVWGNHEGSMLLWVLILAGFGAAVAYGAKRLPVDLKLRVLAVMGMIGVVFLAFVLLTSNPFLRMDPAPFEGAGLNPVLQDLALALHPPLLYAGYVGLSVSFAFAVAALWKGEVDAAWARFVRPWVLLSWSTLTLGIALGSWWAYYELGWGGWWFWDPVENASLMPWLIATALLHSAIVTERREGLKAWTVFLAMAGFGFSLLGTFLVRSGVLTSVHAFANDPARGVFILAILVLTIGGSFALYAWRAPLLRSEAVFAPISRESALLFNNLLLTVCAATVLIGTLYPLMLEAVTGEVISVGPPYFNATVLPLSIPLLLAMPFGPLLAWKRGDLLGASRRLITVTGLTLGVMLVAYTIIGAREGFAFLGIGLGTWIVMGAAKDIYERLQIGRIPLVRSGKRAFGLPRAAWGAALAHAGLGILVIGVTAAGTLRVDHVEVLAPGASLTIAGYELRLDATGSYEGPNYWSEYGDFTVLSDGRAVKQVRAERRRYPAERQATTEVALHATLWGDLYVVLGEEQVDGSGWAVTAAVHPLVRWIWFGAALMGLGGFISLTDTRFRIGAPRGAKGRAKGRAEGRAEGRAKRSIPETAGDTTA